MDKDKQKRKRREKKSTGKTKRHGKTVSKKTWKDTGEKPRSLSKKACTS